MLEGAQHVWIPSVQWNLVTKAALLVVVVQRGKDGRR